jgi:tRNA pseudouridine38-40 synthase
MTRYRATLAYDGTAYAGFQRQVGDTPTIQGALETALRRVSGQAATVTGAGRTDAGVHASGQVVAFDVIWRHPPGDLLRALNANLPSDIALQAIARGGGLPPPTRPQPDVLNGCTTGASSSPWGIVHWRVEHGRTGAMRQGGGPQVGEHDFATSASRRAAKTRCGVVASTLALDAQGRGLIQYEITDNAYLKRMVRSIVGTLVEVGRGAMTVTEFEAAFRAASRSLAGPSAPPMGLTLVRVDY